MRTLCSEEAALADRSIVLVPPGARDTFRLDVNAGDLPVGGVICVAHKDGTPGVRGVALSHETYAVVLLEVVSLSTVCELLPCLEQDLESVRYFCVIAFLVGVQVTVERASGGLYVSFGGRVMTGKTPRVTVFPKKDYCVSLELEVAVHLASSLEKYYREARPNAYPTFQCLAYLLFWNTVRSPRGAQNTYVPYYASDQPWKCSSKGWVHILMIINEGDSISRTQLHDSVVEDRTKVVLRPSLACIVKVVVQWDVEE